MPAKISQKPRRSRLNIATSEATMLVYGFHTVENLLIHHADELECIYIVPRSVHAASLWHLAQAKQVMLQEKDKQQLSKLSGGHNHQGVVAQLRPFHYEDWQHLREQRRAQTTPSLWLVLEQLQDPHNLGALLRSSYLLGVEVVVLAKDRCCGVSVGTLKSASGAARLVKICQVVNVRRALQQLQEDGVWVVGTSGEATTPVSQIDAQRPLAMVLGGEAQGMRRLTAQSCDVLVHIPCRDAHFSFNVAVAGGIVLYEIAQQRAHGRVKSG